MSAATARRPKRGTDTSTGQPGWAIRYKHPKHPFPGWDWHRDERAARHFARLFRRYGCEVRIVERNAGGDRWWLLHPDGEQLVPLSGDPARRTA
jgi:hypothetical protein